MERFDTRTVAQYTGIPYSTLKDFKSRKVAPSKKTVSRIMDVIDSFCIISNAIERHAYIKNGGEKDTDCNTPPVYEAQKQRTSTGKLTDAEVNRRVERLGIKKCPRCGGEVAPRYNKEDQNHFLGCENWRKSKKCKWSVNLT